MKNSYLNKACFSLKPAINRSRTALHTLLLAWLPLSASSTELTPYTAVYTSTAYGISAELDKTLKKVSDNHWILSNKTSILFTGFEETSEFLVDGQRVQPLRYEYNNKLSKKRSSQLEFNWDDNTVFDKLHSEKPLPLSTDSWDKLSIQPQLRLELLNDGDNYTSKTYPLVDNTKVKPYVVTKLGEEQLETSLGTFTAVKFDERRVGKNDKHLLVWLAKDWDYLILRLQRIKDGEVEYQVDLKHAELAGKTVKGK